MDKAKARVMLENYLSELAFENCGKIEVSLPIREAVVFRKHTKREVTQYTFRYLLKIAYDLKD